MPYVAFFPAVAFCAWFCGLGPSIASSAIGLAVLKSSFITPGHALAVASAKQAFHMIALGAAAAIVVALGEMRHRECEDLRPAQSESEVRVRERTAELDAGSISCGIQISVA